MKEGAIRIRLMQAGDFDAVVGTLSLVVLLTSAQIRTWPANYYFPELYFVESRCTVLEPSSASRASSSSSRT